MDYPSANAVAGDLFRFTMPRDAVLEVNDPELGRQLYSEARAHVSDSASATHTQGAK